MDQLFQIDWSFVGQVGNNPFQAMLFFFISGGWIIFVLIMLWAVIKLFQAAKQNAFNARKEFVVLAIDIPRMHEQGPRAVENMFAYLAGAHQPNTWTENWIIGRTQDTISMEIISIDGNVQYLIRTTRQLRDLIEAAVYSQYADAEIVEVEDYVLKVPQHFPDEEWDLWGTEMVPVANDVYPLKTYPFFEDKVSMEFKDPMSAMLESFSRIGPGEQAWYQIVIYPIAQKDFQKKGEAVIKKLLGRETPAKKNILDHAVDLPLKGAGMLVEGLMGSGEEVKPKKKEQPGQPKIMSLTQGEKDIVGAIENKISKIAFKCKVRFLYVAKKSVMSKARIVNPFIGAIKQYNTNNMQSLKPETKHVGVNGALWWFKTSRNNERKNRLLRMYRSRTTWAGTQQFHMCTEELASLWHFPHSLQVKAPQVKKTESKRSEPPANLPFA